MKTTLTRGLIGLTLLLTWASPTLAVNGDLQAPCWRGQAGTTRQTWRFDSGDSPTAPEVVSNGAGSPQATIAPNANGVGWVDTSCALYGIGCDPQNGDPDPFGTAQGDWDLGGTNASVPLPGTVLLTVPNVVSATATRYLWMQATVWIESGIATYPVYAISNAVQIGSAVNVLAENPTNADGSFTSGVWNNQQTLWSVSATSTFNNLVLKSAGVGTIVDTVVVDTLQRLPAGNDTASTPGNTATNLAAATLLANDSGPTLSVLGVSTPSAQGGTVILAGGVVTYTPPAGYTGSDSFYYTNSDCVGGTAAGQVVVAVGPVANPDTFTRTQGLPLKMAITNLLANDTGTSLVFIGAGPTSTNGGSVSNNVVHVFYTPPSAAAYDVPDRFSYTISNNAGLGTGFVYIQVVGATSGLVVVRLETGVPGPNTNTVTLAGIPNYPYVVQFATNLTNGVWFNLSTNNAGGNGLWTVLDCTATNTQRYYRVRTP